MVVRDLILSLEGEVRLESMYRASHPPIECAIRFSGSPGSVAASKLEYNTCARAAILALLGTCVTSTWMPLSWSASLIPFQ